jgi:hypothetical protein
MPTLLTTFTIAVSVLAYVISVWETDRSVNALPSK